MLFIRFMRWLRGYICFAASDGFPERFLNLCNQAGVVLWDAAWRGDTMLGKTDRRGFTAMRACAEPAGVVLRAQCKRGLPFFLYEYRRRAGMLAGLAICVVTLAVLSGMVWTIEVRGNNLVAEEDILRVMEEQGLRLGVWRARVDVKAVSEAARAQLPGVSFLSLNLRGSSAVIEVREELLYQPRPPENPRSIVAAKAGQIKLLEVYRGSPAAGIGQAVLPGALLASGEIANLDATYRYVRAEAYAVARTSVACETTLPRSAVDARLSLRKTHYTLCFLRLRVPLGPRPRKNLGGTFAMEDSFTWAPGGKAMPLSVVRVTYAAPQPRERIKNDRQLQLAAAAAFFDQMYDNLRAAQVVWQQVALELGEDGCCVAMEGAAYENVGMEAEIAESGGLPHHGNQF